MENMGHQDQLVRQDRLDHQGETALMEEMVALETYVLTQRASFVSLFLDRNL